MKFKSYKNGCVSMEKMLHSGMYLVQCYIGTELHDKVRCEDYRTALDYFRCFSLIAKNA